MPTCLCRRPRPGLTKTSICRPTPLSNVASRRSCTYDTYMPNKTISIPDDVVPVIESLGVPFSRWVTDQLRRHAATSAMSFADQVLADAALAENSAPLTRETVGERMERSAPW